MEHSDNILKARDFLCLAKQQLSEDHLLWRREQAAFFIIQAANFLEHSSQKHLNDLVAVARFKHHGSKSDVAILWAAISELEPYCRLEDKRNRYFRSIVPRLARDLGVALVTLIVVLTAYRKYHKLPANLWAQVESQSDFTIISAKQSYGQLQMNKTVEGKPILVGGKTYDKGWGTHAESEIFFKISKDAKVFSGACGYPDSAVGAEIKCSIWLGSLKVWESPTLNTQRPLDRFRFDLNGNKQLTFKIDSGPKGINAAHAVWVDLSLSHD